MKQFAAIALLAILTTACASHDMKGHHSGSMMKKDDMMKKEESMKMNKIQHMDSLSDADMQ